MTVARRFQRRVRGRSRTPCVT